MYLQSSEQSRIFLSLLDSFFFFSLWVSGLQSGIQAYSLNVTLGVIFFPERRLKIEKRVKSLLFKLYFPLMSVSSSLKLFLNFITPNNLVNWIVIAFVFLLRHTWKPMHQFQPTIMIRLGVNFLTKAHETYVYTYWVSLLIAHYCRHQTMIIVPQSINVS